MAVAKLKEKTYTLSVGAARWIDRRAKEGNVSASEALEYIIALASGIPAPERPKRGRPKLKKNKKPRQALKPAGAAD